MTSEQALRAMLTEIVNKAVPAGVDSTGHSMLKLRTALIAKAAGVLKDTDCSEYLKENKTT